MCQGGDFTKHNGTGGNPFYHLMLLRYFLNPFISHLIKFFYLISLICTYFQVNQYMGRSLMMKILF